MTISPLGTQVYDGVDGGQRLVQHSCGTRWAWPHYPEKVITSGPEATLVLITDSDTTATGFRFRYRMGTFVVRKETLVACSVCALQMLKPKHCSSVFIVRYTCGVNTFVRSLYRSLLWLVFSINVTTNHRSRGVFMKQK